MKKKLLFLALGVGLMTAAFSGCSKQPSTESTASDEASESSRDAENAEAEKEEESGEEASEDSGEVKPVAVRIEQVTHTASADMGDNINKTEAQYEYPRLYLDDESAGDYPELAKALEQYNSKYDADKDSVLETLKEEYAEVKDVYSDDSSMYISENLKGSVLRADSNIVSILFDYEDFHGGAHGYYCTYGVNFDTQTGKELCLGDVIKDKDAFIKLVSEKFFEEYTKNPDYTGLKDAGEELQGYDFNSNDNILWSIDPEGVTVYFAPYTLGAFALGAQDISIYFDEAPEIFNEQYTRTCENYIMPLDAYKSVSIDTGTGKREKVDFSLNSVGDAEWGIYQPKFSIGNLDINSDWECYSMECYLMHFNDKYYIYAFQTTDNDYVFLSVIDLANKSLDSSRNQLLHINRYYSSDYSKENYSLWVNGFTALTNPEHLVLATSIDTLGTYSGHRAYHVGDDGYPAADEDYYISESEFAFKAARDLELDVVDESGNVTGKENVPAGTYLAVVRTDGESFADVQAVDESEIEVYGEDEWKTYHLNKSISELADTSKTMYRINVDRSEYPYRANGAEETELFEGLMYAG